MLTITQSSGATIASPSRVAVRGSVREAVGVDKDTARRDSALARQAVAAHVIAVDGDLAPSSVEQIEHTATLGMAEAHGRLVLDLTAVTFIANAELVALVALLRRLRRKDLSIAIAGGDPRASQLLTSIELEGVAFTRTVGEALTTHGAAPSVDGTPPTQTSPGERDGE